MAHDVSTLTVTQLPSAVSADSVASCDPRTQLDLTSYRPDGRGCDPHLTIADVLERRGAFYEGELVEVVQATLVDSESDGTPIGEALVRDSAFTSPEYVGFGELAVPSKRDLRAERDDVNVSVPAMYRDAIRKREEIIDACPIDVYCSSVSQAWAWPWKLTSYYEAAPAAERTCETLMVDSGVRAWGSPTEVLNAAGKLDAEWVFATDVTGMESPSRDAHNSREYPAPEDHGGVFDAALVGIERFIELAGEIGCLGKVILPIQPPYIEFLDACAERGWLDAVDYIAIGGLLNVGAVDDRIDALRNVREYVGTDMRIHALAPSAHPALLWELREQPGLVDSIDLSTPEVAPSNNQLPDVTWRQARNKQIQGQHTFAYGEGASTIRAAASEMLSLQLAQMLSPLTSERTYREAFRGHLPDPEANKSAYPLTPDDLGFYLPGRFDDLLDELNGEAVGTADGAQQTLGGHGASTATEQQLTDAAKALGDD